MTTKTELTHRTAYHYSRPVALGPQVIQLRPAPYCRTPITGYALSVTPADHFLNWQFDSLGNQLARVTIPGKTSDFIVEVKLIADLSPINPFAFLLDPGCETFPFTYPADLSENLAIYRALLPAGPLFQSFLDTISVNPQNTVAFVGDITSLVRNRVAYARRFEAGVQTPEETLQQRTGSCRDSAWLLVQTFRHLGLAARFVSGYLIQLASEDPDARDAVKQDSADLHAWAEVFLPGAGWVGLDPTSGLFTAEGHIPLMGTPSPTQAAPVFGTNEPAEVDFTFDLTLRRLDSPSLHAAAASFSGEPPSLDAPITEEEWQRVRSVAHEVDRQLQQHDVRLTMGGEPTYVGADEPENFEWNLGALGPNKRTLGLALLRRLHQRTAPGGLLHFGQGKWYPGEPLPRWAFVCVSRIDAVPVWENISLIADGEQPSAFTRDDALRFVQALARRLQVTGDSIFPAYEPFPDDAATPTGYILPLRRRQHDDQLAWSSQPWFPRPDRLVLSPGDSPIGYRITADLVPFVAPEKLTYEMEPAAPDTASRHKLPPHPARRADLFAATPPADPLPALTAAPEDAPELVRPALCVQAVDGHLHVFLPYVPALPDYLDLIAAVEDTCEYLGTPVLLEGYTPPHDPRLRFFGLTPDPGVLEVNLPATSTWDDLESLHEILHHEALANGLIAGKFTWDGNHISTGGGSHIVMGSTSVDQSPVLRRPDLLRSMLTFWQRHPSLSYLFSGMYVGPTSQYPRVDEARVDALYELEVAFSQLPHDAAHCPPNILDGLFRNLLVDVTGNTHRAEFCIDKMFPPINQGLRAGLLELRAFEMPPHFRMGLLQMLLVRALVCTFWQQPCTDPLIRWGATLHDRFMLPHFVWQDFAEVLDHLRVAGFALEADWFHAQFEFRFPCIGTVTASGVTLELRQALEPWNVLAEETSAGGTGRSVDSSLERIQVTLSGLGDLSRYVVAVNGRRVPLMPTGRPGELIAGIRYRARRLSNELHPSIPIHLPLVFDLIDTTTSQSLARCTYFAGNPDGSLYETRPRNPEEAATRRHQRFQASQPPTDTVPTPPEEHNPTFPMTLDLRFPRQKTTGGSGCL